MIFDLFVTLGDSTRQALSRLANVALAILCYKARLEGESFTLEKDDDSEQKTSKNNIART